MTAFVDSSALVKFYVAEAQHKVVRSIDEPMVISTLAQVEVPAAMWRKHRLGEIDANDASILCAEFAADLSSDELPAPRFAVIGVVDEIVGGAAQIVARHPLRAYDAVQLATAIVVRNLLGEITSFVTFDDGLRSAAAAEGFALVPHEIDRNAPVT